MNLVALQTKPSNNFEANLANLELLIANCDEKSFIAAPELALTGYAYERQEEASELSKKAIEVLKELSKNKTISITLLTEKNNQYFNTLFIFHQSKIVHTQSKYHLFVLNEEKEHFAQGEIEDIQVIEIEGLKVGAMICFELRFIELWQKLRGADIILIPAMWGAKRKDNFEALTKALAITNQCFVLASSSASEDCAKGSGIISPLGYEYRDDEKELIKKDVDLDEITQMRTYLNVGINNGK